MFKETTMTAKFDRIAAKVGKEKALERARAYLCSLYLGRDWLETTESYEARRPEVVELKTWISKNS
jgi:hypothetical protein